MPQWLIDAIAKINPMTSEIPAAEALVSAIEAELKSGDDTAAKCIAIGEALVKFAAQIETAFKANTPVAGKPSTGAALR